MPLVGNVKQFLLATVTGGEALGSSPTPLSRACCPRHDRDGVKLGQLPKVFCGLPPGGLGTSALIETHPFWTQTSFRPE